jgi:hypothetical protein
MHINGDLVSIVGGGAAGIALITAIIRFVFKNINGSKLEKITTDAEMGTFARMQTELARLSVLCDTLSAELTRLKIDRELDVVDLSKLLVSLGHMPCGNCNIDPQLFREAEQAVAAILDRKFATSSFTSEKSE